jgi:hypothetical protein
MTAFIGGSTLFAQQPSGIDAQKVIAPADFLSILVPPEQVEGRTILFSDWQQGEVFLSQGRFASGITFNYDVLNDVLLVLVEEKEYSLNPIAVDSILIANSSQVLINPIILDGIGGDVLLLRVYQGAHLSLFRSTLAKVLEDRDINTAAIEQFKYVRDDIEIDEQQMYFLQDRSTREITEFQGKRKELKSWENGDQITSFVKSKELDLKNESDLIQVIQYYEQLISN